MSVDEASRMLLNEKLRQVYNLGMAHGSALSGGVLSGDVFEGGVLSGDVHEGGVLSGDVFEGGKIPKKKPNI